MAFPSAPSFLPAAPSRGFVLPHATLGTPAPVLALSVIARRRRDDRRGGELPSLARRFERWSPMRWSCTLRRLAFAVLLGLCGPLFAASAPAVAAAADLKFALSEIAGVFARETGRNVRLSFGSSGNFTQQIEQGAPFELFLSADENYVFRLADKGFAVDRGVPYAVGRLVLFVPQTSPLKADASFADLRAALNDGRLKRFAIANPEHAPYGRAARAALQHAGLWTALQPKLVLGENASQATQFAAAGSSQGGIIPLALSKAPEIARLGAFAAIPAEWHAAEPLRQRMVLTRKAGETARAFFAWLQTPAARAIFVRHGFSLPVER